MAPPVAKAEKILINRILMESTKEIPDTAASPQVATINVSAIPMVMAKNCSTTKGNINLISCFLENICTLLPLFAGFGCLLGKNESGRGVILS